MLDFPTSIIGGYVHIKSAETTKGHTIGHASLILKSKKDPQGSLQGSPREDP